jgi:hypothetical protein
MDLENFDSMHSSDATMSDRAKSWLWLLLLLLLVLPGKSIVLRSCVLIAWSIEVYHKLCGFSGCDWAHIYIYISNPPTLGLYIFATNCKVYCHY